MSTCIKIREVLHKTNFDPVAAKMSRPIADYLFDPSAIQESPFHPCKGYTVPLWIRQRIARKF